MVDPLAVALKFVFLFLLFVFVAWVVRSSSRELDAGGAREFDPLLAGGGDGAAPIDLVRGVHPRLVVVAAHHYEPGTAFDIVGELLLGRSAPVDVVVEDPFASSRHARIVARGPYNLLEDLGSTNGTYLNGHRLDGPERLEAGDTITIGDTEFRYDE